MRTVELDVSVLCQDESGDPTGDLWQRINIRLSPTEWEAAQRAGVTFTLTVPVKAVVKTVKVIVYDFASDRLGSATKIVR